MPILEARNMDKSFFRQGLERLLGLKKEEKQSIKEETSMFQRCPSEGGVVKLMRKTDESIPDLPDRHQYRCSGCNLLYVPKQSSGGEYSIIKQECPQDGLTFMEITAELIPQSGDRHWYRCLSDCHQIYVGKESKQ